MDLRRRPPTLGGANQDAVGGRPRIAVNRQDLQAAETVIERRQHLGNPIGAPDQRQRAAWI